MYRALLSIQRGAVFPLGWRSHVFRWSSRPAFPAPRQRTKRPRAEPRWLNVHAHLALLALLSLSPTGWAAEGAAEVLTEYRAAGAGPFDAARGAAMWQRKVTVDGQKRACSDCHGADLTGPGEHVRTGKRIEPMAISVNPQRLTEAREIRKWFLRNCKWAWGRECNPQEKGDFLAFIQSNQEGQ